MSYSSIGINKNTGTSTITPSNTTFTIPQNTATFATGPKPNPNMGDVYCDSSGDIFMYDGNTYVKITSNQVTSGYIHTTYSQPKIKSYDIVSKEFNSGILDLIDELNYK